MQSNSWEITEKALIAIVKPIKSAAQAALHETGLHVAGTHWTYLILATAIAPEPVTVARYYRYQAYISPDRIAGALQILSAHGFLRPAGSGAFVASRRAIASIDQVTQAQRAMFAAMDVGSESELERAIALLSRIYTAIEQVDAFPTHSFDDAKMRSITPQQPLVEQVARYLSHLASYRTDCHLAAWCTHTDDGRLWDALTFVWRDDAHSAAELAAAAGNRGYSETDYADALHSLVEMGWLMEESQGRYGVTESGRSLREEAEAETEHNFSIVWDGLDADEREELLELLIVFSERAKAIIQPN